MNEWVGRGLFGGRGGNLDEVRFFFYHRTHSERVTYRTYGLRRERNV